MNSAIEVKDTPTEDLPLDEDYLGVNFNIEAADEVENGTPSVYLESLAPVDLQGVEEENREVVPEETYCSANVDSVVPSVVNGIDKSPALPVESKKKRPYQRRSSIKAVDIIEQQPQTQQPAPGSPPPSQQPVVKLHKLSPGTIAKHTVREVENNGEVEVAVVPTPKKRSNVNGPGLLRQNKHIKKKFARPRTGVGKKWDGVRVKEEKPESEKLAVVSSGNELADELVECVRCTSVVPISSARQHLSVCIPVTPVKENDTSPGLPSSSPALSGVPAAASGGSSSGRGYSTRASSMRSVQSTYGPDACGLCGARGLSDGLARYLHTHLHHQRFTCIICGSMHSKVSALVKHLQAVHGKEDRFYQGPDVGAQLSQVLGRASILICTECGLAIHVLDVEPHSLNCKATPRFPLPSQVGYHSDSQQQPLAITYPMPPSGGGSAAAAAVAAAAGITPLGESQSKLQKRRYRTKIKKEPASSDYPALPEGYQLTEPKAEPVVVQPKSENLTATIDAVASAGAEDEGFLTPTEDDSMINQTADSIKSDQLDGSDHAAGGDFESNRTVKKKAKVMLPSHGSPGRGLRTLLPGNRGPPPSPPKRTRGPGLIRTLPAGGAPGLANSESKNLLCGAEEEVDEEPANQEDLTGTPADRTEEPMAATREASPAPQLPPRDKKDWKSTLEPLLYKLLLRIKKALRRVQLLHCPVCIRYETHESSLEEICLHLKAAHNNHLLRGLGEDTHNRLFAEISSIYMEDVSNEEAEEYVDTTSCRKVLLKFCVEPLDKTYSCDLCNVNELSVKEMVQHLRGAHGFRMYPCLECGQQFKTYGYFISHLVSTGKESIYGCRLCGIVGMVSLYMLQSHLRTHSLCDICHTCFESQTALRKHMFNHQQDSPYACTVCQVSYKNYESLEMHLLWKHGTESKPCPTCQEKTWLCTYHFCPGAPANLSEVVDNPCVCTVCRLEFSKASMLKVHTRLHTGERPHKCASCKKSFISKKLLTKHTAMKHSEAAINQAAVAQAAANEIKSALEKSGLRPKKLQQELLKLIGQQNAAKRSTSAAPSAAPSRRVSTEDGGDQQLHAKSEASQDSADVKTPEGIAEVAPNEPDSVKAKEEEATKEDDSASPVAPVPTSLVPQLGRLGSSIFDIEDDEVPPAAPPSQSKEGDRDQDSAIGGSPVGAAKEEGEEDKKPEVQCSEDESEVKNAENETSGLEDQTTTKEEPGPEAEQRTDENLLDLLASAASSKQAEIPTQLQPPPTPPPLPPPPKPEPVIPPALLDHDYCTFGEPPADKIKPKSPRKTHRHSKKHKTKKEPRFVLDLSSSSSDEDGDGAGNVNGKAKKTNRSFKFGKVSQLSDSESSYCDSNCSCSGSGSSSSSSSSSSSGSSSDDSSSSSSSSDSEDEKEAATSVAKGASAVPASAAPEKGGDDEMDVDVENNSNEPSSPESSSDSENEEVESDADISVHESDLETSDSDSENKKRLRTSPNRSEIKKRKKKKKKKRRAFKDSALLSDGQSKGAGISDGLRLLSSSSNVDDVINAVASGHFRSTSKSSRSASKVRKDPGLLLDGGSDRSVGFGAAMGPAVGVGGGSVGGNGTGGKRGRGKRKRSDDMYWYEEDNIDGMLTNSKKKKLKVAASTPANRTTAKLKFTHKYDTFQRSGASAAQASASSSFVGKPLSAPPNPFEDPDRLYCYCRCPYDEVSQMIGCDANDCPYEWFHFECVGISEAPEGQWYCPECRLRPKYRAQFDEPFFQPPPPPQQII